MNTEIFDIVVDNKFITYSNTLQEWTITAEEAM